MTGASMTQPPHPWSLAGQTAVVTGAGSPKGIGFAAARLLGLLGAAVAIASTTDRIHERSAELQAQGIEALGVVADLTDQAQVAALATAVKAWRADCGHFGQQCRLGFPRERVGCREAVRGSHPRRVGRGLARNLRTTFLVTQAFLPGMKSRGYGRIVNVSSTTGPLVAIPLLSPYATAKAGIVGLTRALGLELALSGITVNAVGPGWIATAAETATLSRSRAGLADAPRRDPRRGRRTHRLPGFAGGFLYHRSVHGRRWRQFDHRGQGAYLTRRRRYDPRAAACRGAAAQEAVFRP